MSTPGRSTSVLLATLSSPAPGGGEITGELRDYGDDVTASARAGRYELERDVEGTRWYVDEIETAPDQVPRELREQMLALADTLWTQR